MTRGEYFLPVSRDEMIDRGWYYYDFLVVTADGYIDHPSFGSTLIARLLEAEGYRVAILAQPDWHSAEPFRAMGKPRYGVLIGGGNLDSMVAHYTVAKRRRTRDLYSPGGKLGCRPDRPGFRCRSTRRLRPCAERSRPFPTKVPAPAARPASVSVRRTSSPYAFSFTHALNSSPRFS